MALNDPIEENRRKVMDITAIAIFFIFPFISYQLRGIDFAKGTLLGSGVVFLNYLISQRIILKFITEKSFSIGLGLVYILKFGGTIGLLYFAVTIMKLDTWGVLLGLSSIIITIAFSSVVRVFFEKNQNLG